MSADPSRTMEMAVVRNLRVRRGSAASGGSGGAGLPEVISHEIMTARPRIGARRDLFQLWAQLLGR